MTKLSSLEEKLIKELKGARLMLYAYQGARLDFKPGIGPHKELDAQIVSIETLLAQIRLDEAQ